MITFPIQKTILHRWPPALAMVVYLSAAFFSLESYLRWQSPVFYLGLFTIFLTCRETTTRQPSFHYGIAAIITGIITCMFPVKTLFFFFASFILFYVLESYRGKLTHLSLFALLLTSPLCSHFILQFGFTIRLHLTAIAGHMLKVMVPDTTVRGNIIIMNGSAYAVDPACMGLNMMVTSLITGILLITLRQQKLDTRVRMLHTCILLGCIVLLNIICNLMRILVLSYYNILPENILHDIAGIVCFVVYLLLPVYMLTAWMVKKRTSRNSLVPPSKPRKTIYSLLHITLFILFCTACYTLQKRPPAISFNPDAGINGYTTSVLPEKGVLKIEGDQSLIYIKPIPNCYAGEHHPVFCWTGSGYTFTKIKLQAKQTFRYYTAQLENEKDLLFTAWWYDNGYTYTTEQWQWRWEMLKGKHPYALINITTATEAELEKEIKRFKQTVNLKKLWNNKL